MTKPGGPLCNLDCDYCFYLEKVRLFSPGHSFRMSDEVMEKYIRDYIGAQGTEEVQFAWQGGEPTLLGVDYFRKIVRLQEKYAGGKRIANALQTNGTLLDDEWGAFLHEKGFLVGISIDGPRELHDAYRVDRGGKATFDRVMRGLEILKTHRVEFNTLTVLHRHNVRSPKEVYRFLKKVGSSFLQFIPLVERLDSAGDNRSDEREVLLHPEDAGGNVAPWCPRPYEVGQFLVRVFDEWVRRDVGKVFVQMFDSALGSYVGAGAGLCVFDKTCGRCLAIEHDGDVYSCDHYVYPSHRLGNVTDTPLSAMVGTDRQRAFGEAKVRDLPKCCRECSVLYLCNGGCPKHRILRTPDGEAGLNYLCAGYRSFFRHIEPSLRVMGNLLQGGRPAADIMRQ